METTVFGRLRIAAAFVILAFSAFADIFAATTFIDDLEFYLIGNYNGWIHDGDDAKFSLGDDGLWHKTLSLRTDQGIKVVNVDQRLFSSANNLVTDEMIKAKTPIQLEEKGDANDDDDLIAHPIIYLQNEATREFILDGETMTLTVAGVPHDLTLTPVTQGTAQLSTHSARWGDEITISYEPMDGYSLKDIEVTCEDGSTVTVNDDVFEMPDQPVTVTVTFEEIRSGQCGDNLSWFVNEDGSLLTIQGSGPMYDYEMYNQPWLNFRDKIIDISIGDGVETLGAYVFFGMSSLTNPINIPNSVVSIGESCFEYSKISSVQLPATITSIGKNAFHYTEITAVNLEDCTSDEFTTLPEGVFQHTSINTITIPANINKLGDNSIADNLSLQDVTLLCETTPQLGSNVFGGVRATLMIDNVDVYHAIRKVGSHWGDADEFTIRPIDDKSFRYAVIEGIEDGYVYTGQPIQLSPQLILCDEELTADDYEMKYYKDNDEVESVVETGTYRCEFTPSDGSEYKDNISKSFIVADGGIAYIDERGNEQILPNGLFTEFADEMDVLENKWYVVNSDVDVSSRIEVSEDGAKILLCNGYTLTANQGIHCSNKELAIYGQSGNTGKLIAVGNEKNAGIGGDIHESGPVLTINGGDILVTSSEEGSAAAIGGGDQGYWSGTYGSNNSVTINGGKVEAFARGYGAGIGGGGTDDSDSSVRAGSGGVIVINGGQVDASSEYGYGIGPGRIHDFSERDGEPGNITLGWNNCDNQITATSYCGTVIIKDGQALCYQNSLPVVTLSGTLDSGQIDAIKNETLYPVVMLQDNESNDIAALAASFGDITTNMVLYGRTLTKNGTWNTLCLPFAVTAAMIDENSHPLHGAIIMELDVTGLEKETYKTRLDNDGTLNLCFTTVYDGSETKKNLEAGKPYIVKWETTGNDISNPTFTDVTISSTAPTPVTSNDNHVQFVGQYSPFEIINSNATGSNQGNLNEILLLSNGNKLGYSTSERTISNKKALRCFRAHFYVPANNGTMGIHRFVLDFGDEETGMTITNYTNKTAIWYDLSGRCLSGQPTHRGMYIKNGKVVIK